MNNPTIPRDNKIWIYTILPAVILNRGKAT
jgi:hypothetical protein